MINSIKTKSEKEGLESVGIKKTLDCVFDSVLNERYERLPVLNNAVTALWMSMH